LVWAGVDRSDDGLSDGNRGQGRHRPDLTGALKSRCWSSPSLVQARCAMMLSAARALRPRRDHIDGGPLAPPGRPYANLVKPER
jgi:hypothetical protein